MENFLAINIIDKTGNECLTKTPIIYFWDGKEEIENAFKTEVFKNFALRKINKNNYLTTNIYLIYTYSNDEDFDYTTKEYVVKDIFSLSDLHLDIAFINEVMEFLYKCAYKKETNLSIKEIFESLQKKYPLKINETVVGNFILSFVKEHYPSISEKMLEEILEKFRIEIKS